MIKKSHNVNRNMNIYDFFLNYDKNYKLYLNTV